MLTHAGVNLSVMPLVPQISAGCGIALRVDPSEIKRCLAFMASENVMPSAVYERKRGEDGYEYTELNLVKILTNY